VTREKSESIFLKSVVFCRYISAEHVFAQGCNILRDGRNVLFNSVAPALSIAYPNAS